MLLGSLAKLVTGKEVLRSAIRISSGHHRGLITSQLKLLLMADTDNTQAVQAPKNTSAGTSTTNRDRCIFCRIVDGKEKDSAGKILYQDDEFVAFPDIRPATKHHLLIVTKEHIKDAKSLTPSQIGLLDRLVETGQKVLLENMRKEDPSVNAVPEKTLMGFHWPPFHTVSHLHLHVISPSDQIGFIGRIIFRPNSYWFVQPDWVKSRLEKLKNDGKPS